MGARGPWTGWVLRIFVAGIFLFAAVGKALAPTELLEALTSLGVPDPLLWPGAILLLAAELAVAVLLLRARFAALGAMLAMGLSAGFLAVTADRLHRGSPESCACFGLFLSLPPEQVLRLDAALLFAALILRLRAAKPRQPAVSHAAVPDARGSWRWAAAFGLACVLMLAAGGWLVATAEPEPASAGHAGTPLRFGQLAPYVQEVRGATEPGRWRLVYFTCPDCREAGLLLDDVFEHIRPYSLQLRGTVVVGGPTETKINAGLAQVRSKLPAGWSAIADPDDHLLDAYAGRPRRRPFAALLDRDGKALYVADGYSTQGASLGEELSALAMDRPVSAADRGIYTLHVGRRLPEGVRALVADEMAWHARQDRGSWSVLALVDLDCSSCQRLLQFLDRCAKDGAPVPTLLVLADDSDLREARAKALPACVRPVVGGHALRASMAPGAVPAVYAVVDERISYAVCSIAPLAGLLEASRQTAWAPGPEGEPAQAAQSVVSPAGEVKR